MRHEQGNGTAIVLMTMLLIAIGLLLLGGGALVFYLRQARVQQIVMAEQAMVEAEALRAAVEAQNRSAAQAMAGGAASNEIVYIDETTAPPDAQLNLTVEQQVLEMLAAQETAWQQGKITDVVAQYHQDASILMGQDSLSGPEELEAYLNSVREKTPLSYQDLVVRELPGGIAIVTGQLHLGEPEVEIQNTTLVFRRMDDKWAIIHHHSGN